MKRNNWYPTSVAGQILWQINFASKLPGLATVLGLTPAQVAGIVADCLWVIYILQEWLPAVRALSTSGTTAATEAQLGDGTS